MMKTCYRYVALIFLVVFLWGNDTFSQTINQSPHCDAYLFVYFTGNGKGEEAIRFALSNDGYNYRALNNNNPIVDAPRLSSTGGLRDPHILRAADGKTFYMVATDMNVSKNGWGGNYSMVLMQSKDLINWSSTIVNIPNTFPEFAKVNRVWAPQTIYDSTKDKYMVYWSMRFGNEPDKIYYAYTNKEFTSLETTPKQLFFSPDNGACIDGDIAIKDGRYNLFFKTEKQKKAGIKKAVSDKLTEGYVLGDKYLEQTSAPVEGGGTFKLNNSDDWILMYDMYTSGKYQFTKSKDLEHFSVVDNEVSMNFHPRHGTIMPITAQEEEALVAKWMDAKDVILFPNAPEIRKQNIVYDAAKQRIVLPVQPNTNLESFNPAFILFPGVAVQPSIPQNFTTGSIDYSVQIAVQKPQHYTIEVIKNHNPALPGYYADPDILYAEKTKKFYLYPTTDGFTNWSGNYFKTFSSTDLVDWKDEGVILDLPKDVSWGKKNAWAPSVIERKIDGQYKYFIYFCAAQKIGVAVSDNPTGPFVDMGKPLIDKFPGGISKGLQIDPAVFKDSQSGKYYLYWGNAYMAGAELNEDMVSIKPETIKVLTPANTYREGSYVFYRKGTYYFMWSEDDTRSENYHVCYGTSNSPLGDIHLPKDNLVLAKDKALGIYGTGHNSVIQVPGKDEWYIIYHRFTYPNGITMGKDAGYNREVCIDSLTFNEDGTIQLVTPTHKGILPVKIR